MKEQGITNMVKALQRRGMTIPDIIATIADAQGISEAHNCQLLSSSNAYYYAIHSSSSSVLLSN